jgi:hypothetical protein
MNHNTKYTTPSIATLALVLCCLSYSLAQATPAADDRSLARGATEDVTPRQRYDSAIREAGGAYKESLRDCASAPAAERPACVREAKATYDRDMADARRLLREPVRR